ncbi:MAG: AMP-binding protein, partial [Lachnospiraceae bacterium]|nr:AMP-binding protein [Lachnospiraceae bacterium]
MNQLTSAQKNIWNLQKFYENTTISTICGAIVYEKIISSEMLQRALNLFIQEQESLRLQFRIVNGEPYQYVVPYEEELFPVVSFSTEQEYLEFVNMEKSRKFTLVDEKMYRFFICQFFDHTALLLLVNHLIMDAWSVGILGSRVAELVCMYETAGKEYEIAISGKDEMKENQKAYQPQICSYMEHVEREKVYKESGYYQKDQEYWRELYAVKPQIAYIKSEREANTGVNAKRFDVFMEKDFSKEILKFCRVEQITPALLFETALCIYLGKLNLENRAVSIGMMALNRIGNKEKKMAGMFVSTIPFSVSYEEQMTVREMFDLVMKSQGGSFRHQQYPYEEIQRYLKDRHQMSGNLYDVLFSYQNIRIESKLPFYTEWYSNGYSEVALALHVDDRDGNGMFHITMDYQTDIFPHEEEIKLLYKRMICIMRQMMEFPEEKLERISIIPRKEYYRLVEVFNDTHMDYNKDMCVHELFSNQARRTPERIALVFRQNQYTYRQIDEMSNTLAHVLCDTGLDKGSIVPVVAVRGWQVVVA